MKYFYAYIFEKKISNIHQFISLEKDCIFIDDKNTDEQWADLICKIKSHDEIYIPSIDLFSSDEISLKKKLETLKELQVQLLTINEDHLVIDLLLNLMEFIDISRKKRAKQLQREGIDKALAKKYKGEGKFGRPSTQLPVDFGDWVKMIMRKELTHDVYRAQLGMKRSTYYKHVKEEKERWKQEGSGGKI